MKKINKIDIIERFKKIHNSKYDYSLVDYKDMKTKVKIKCYKHGVFEQSPDKHLNGQGCKQCGFDSIKFKQRSTTDIFIGKAKELFGNIYDYSKVKYINSTTKVEIMCLEHGSFHIRPNHHLKKHGCPKCGIEKRARTQSYSIKKFIDLAKRLHGNEYDYSKSIYINSSTPIEIVCKEHGTFYPTPSNHLQGNKCPTCQTKRIGIDQRISNEDFITKASKLHNNIYDYSKVKYSGNKVPITVICKEHGEFTVRPDNHINAMSGCPICNSSKGETKIMNFLDNLNIKYIKEYKIKGYKYRYDFYLPDFNLLIEYDGIQHFKPIERFGGIKEYEKTKRRDKIKNNLATKHEFSIIRIKYFNFNNLENLLLNKLSGIYRYKVNNRFYKNLIELCIGEHLPGTTNLKDVREYLLINLSY